MKTNGTYTRLDDTLASYSSKGPSAIDNVVKPDIVAPGNQVVSLQATNATLVKQNPSNVPVNSYYEATNPGQAKKVSQYFFTLSGTSMAAPVVSGAAAALIQARPSLIPDRVKLLLMQTAYKTFPTSSSVIDPKTGITYTDYYDVFTVGAGYLDVQAALAAVSTVPQQGTAISPIASYDPVTGDIMLSYDPSSVFACRALWGARAMWGASFETSGNTVAERAMWGASILSSTATTAAEANTVSIAGEQ